jgi:hypothetical protein
VFWLGRFGWLDCAAVLLDVLPLGCTLSLSRVTKHNCQGIDIARLFRLAESYCAYRKSHLWAEAVAHKAANQNVRTHTSPRNNREAQEIRTAIAEQEEHFAIGQRESAQLSLG